MMIMMMMMMMTIMMMMLMMMMMMVWMLRLRKMMSRRKTGPKTGKHTLCEPTQSKCIGHVTTGILCRNLQGKCRTLIPG